MKKKYFCLQPAKFRLDGGAMYGIIPKPLWEKKSPPDEQNRIDLDLRLVLIQTNEKNILIDTGIGDYHEEKFDQMFDVRKSPPSLVNALNEINITADQITDLVLTHLHFDHVGGIVTNQNDHTPLFKNATCHLHKKHFEYAQNPTARDSGSFQKKVFLPALNWYIKNNQVHWLEEHTGDIIKECDLKYVSSHGHTPHMIHPYDDQMIYLADIIPTSNHIKIPWVMGYDIYPGQSVQDKTEILKFVFENNLKIIFEHDPEFWGGNVLNDEIKGILPDQLFKRENKPIHQIFY